MFSFHIAFTTFKKQGFTSAEKLVFQIFFLMNIFKGQKENKRPIKCPLMDNKGHFHFELSFKGHVNKKSTASTPVHNCQRAGGPRAVLEARGRHLFQEVEGKGGILTLLTG